MRALALLVVGWALLSGEATAQGSDALREPRDTVGPGQRVRISTAPGGPWQTARLLEVHADSVFLGGGGGWLRTGLLRGSIDQVQVRSGSGAATGAIVGGVFGVTTATAFAIMAASCSDCEGGSVLPYAFPIVMLPIGIGALLGSRVRPARWRGGVLPADLAAGPPQKESKSGQQTRVYLIAGPGIEAADLARLRERLVAAGVSVSDETITPAGRSAAPAEVRYFYGADADRAEALAFWLGRTLARPALSARLYQRPSAAQGDLHVWLSR